MWGILRQKPEDGKAGNGEMPRENDGDGGGHDRESPNEKAIRRLSRARRMAFIVDSIN
jgi:hypothetical protein